MSLHERLYALADRLGLTLDDDRDYATAAGLVLAVLRHLPQVGEHFEHQGWRFEVLHGRGGVVRWFKARKPGSASA